MGQIDTLRKLIREEVRAAIQDQLSEILKEAIIVNKENRQPIAETQVAKKPFIPGTLNTRKAPSVIAPKLSAGNPLNNLLAETAKSMTYEDASSFNHAPQDTTGFGGLMEGFTPEPQVADSVEGMFATARASSNIEMVEINAVPDYTALMSSLREKGAI